MDPRENSQRGVMDDLADEVRRGSLSRSELLKRAGAAGLAIGLPSSLAMLVDDAEAGMRAAPAGTMRIGVAFSAAGSNNPLPGPGPEGRLRNNAVFNFLFAFTKNGQLVPSLARSATPNKNATVWTIRLRQGVTFHDGSPLTADDVIYTFRSILDKKNKAEGAGDIGMVNGAGIRKIDALTVRIPLKYAFSIFPYQLTNSVPIIKNGATTFDPPIGTGAFMFTSADGQKITLARNPNYWESGLPRLAGVEIVNIQDSTARLNALKTGQVDTIYPVDATQIPAVRNNSDIRVYTNRTGTYMPMYMNATKKPFNNVRARQALKYAANRKELNKLAYGGQGYLGNDMFGYFDPGYPRHLPQRQYDPERAKSLWKQAGAEGTKLTFWTADIWPGQVTQALVYAQQAKRAGIDITVKKLPSDQFFVKGYGVQPFSNDYWSYIPILTNMSLGFVPGAPYAQAASWSNPRVTKLYRAATAQTNAKKRNELTADLMTIFRDEGPYVVWAFEAGPQFFNARIGGQENSAIRPLNGFTLKKFFVR